MSPFANGCITRWELSQANLSQCTHRRAFRTREAQNYDKQSLPLAHVERKPLKQSHVCY